MRQHFRDEFGRCMSAADPLTSIASMNRIELVKFKGDNLVRRFAAHFRQRRDAVLHAAANVAFLGEVEAQQVREVRFVLDDKNGFARGHYRLTLAPSFTEDGADQIPSMAKPSIA